MARTHLFLLPFTLIPLSACNRGGGGQPEAAATPAATAKAVPFESIVAHSGGLAKGLDYTNSREALDAAYASGIRWFELDMSTTTDGKVVLVNNWGDGFEKLFPGSDRGRRSHEEFLKLKMADGLTQMDLDRLAEWLRAHPDATVVTDVKDENVAVLKQLAETHAPLLPRFVPQLFHFEEYDPIKPLGFPKLILSVYAMDAGDDEVVEWVKTHPVHAVTMPSERAKASDLAKRLGEHNVPVYAHTVNQKADLDTLRAAGVDGVYTDSLAPKDLGAATPP